MPLPKKVAQSRTGLREAENSSGPSLELPADGAAQLPIQVLAVQDFQAQSGAGLLLDVVVGLDR